MKTSYNPDSYRESDLISVLRLRSVTSSLNNLSWKSLRLISLLILFVFAPLREIRAQDELLVKTETANWAKNCSVYPSMRSISAVNQFVYAEINDGNFTQFDRFWIFGLDASTSALQSIVNPTSTTAVAVNSPTFTPYLGFQGNGSNSYINLEYNPSTQGINFSQNNASGGVFFSTYTNNGACDNGTENTSNSYSGFSIWNEGSMYIGINTNDQALSSLGSSGVHFISGYRIASGTDYGYVDGVLKVTQSISSNTIPNLNEYDLCFNANGSASAFSKSTHAAVYYGGGGISQSALNISLNNLSKLLQW